MPDKKITQLDALTSVTADDVFLVVDDPAGTPTSKKVTAANLAASIAAIGLNAGGSNPVLIHGIELPATHQIRFEGATDNSFETFLTVVDPTADRTITFPDSTGTVALTSDLATYATLASPTLTGTPLAPTATAGTSTTQIATTAFADPQGDQFVLSAAIFTS